MKMLSHLVTDADFVSDAKYSIPLARTERFKRSFVLYALRSFPTDISEDFCDLRLLYLTILLLVYKLAQ